MKKIIALLLTGMLTMSLLACGGNETNQEETNNSENEVVEEAPVEEVKSEEELAAEKEIENVDFTKIFSGEGDDTVIYSQMSELAKKILVGQGLLSKVDVSYTDEGDTVFFVE